MKLSNKIRRKVEEKHGKVCVYCKTKLDEITIDHIVSRCYGGKNNIENLVPACARCNSSKHSHSLDEWQQILQKRLDNLFVECDRYIEIISSLNDLKRKRK